jgi:hypothetical protein
MPGTGCTLPGGYPEPDPALFAAAVVRYRALEKLREFRSRLYACLARRADAPPARWPPASAAPGRNSLILPGR